MKEFKPFISWTYSPETLGERSRLILELVKFVSDGARDPHERGYNPHHEAFKTSVRSRLYVAREKFAPKMPKSWKPIEGDTHTLIIEAFEEALHRSRSEQIACVPFDDSELVEKFTAKFKHPVIETWKHVPPNVLGAFNRSCQNFLQTETRLTATYVIHELTRTDEHSHPEALQGTEEIRRALWERRREFLLNAALFGSLAGGDSAVHISRLMAREMCFNPFPGGIDFAIMHFLEADGVSPGRYETKVEDKFKADIARCYWGME